MNSSIYFDINKKIFRDAMSNLSSAVSIITTNGPFGKAGFTASAVCSVTDSPPTLLVCLNRTSSVYNVFKKNNVLCVNTLNSSQEDLSVAFGGKVPMNERFSYAKWEKLITTSPVLQNSLVSFDCEIVDSLNVGSHDVLFCKILAIKDNNDLDALIYFKRNYFLVNKNNFKIVG